MGITIHGHDFYRGTLLNRQEKPDFLIELLDGLK